ncbi:MAG: hypothetical protein YHS30scaffold324_4 [Catenulispora phage 69_17]|jgi:hypothetical protein|nr:MAG: hypothetical protein YHS30scaffold324_4 [Catenulispora phage 69_17]
MTVTTTAPAPVQQQLDLVALSDAQAVALLLAEVAAADAASWPLRFALAQIRSQLTARQQLSSLFGRGPDVRELRTWTRQQLRDTATLLDRPVVAEALRQAAESAAATGAANAAAQAGIAETITPRLDRAVAAVTRTAPATAAAHLHDAVQALSDAQDPAGVERALAVADRAPAALTLAAQWAVSRAAATSVRATAARIGAELLWIAERDACVVCLALAGHTANPRIGDGFDEFATFGPHRPPAPWPPGQPLLCPPRHPHCHCQIVVWLGSASGQPDLRASLRHEAKRSILRGFSRPSESHAVRIAAARKLLAHGSADMPKSVRAYAAHAVDRGRFPTRDVPHWHPSSRSTP